MTMLQLSEFILRECYVNDSGCLLWPHATANFGYGKVNYRGRVWRCHRLVWIVTNGAIPDGLELLHSCDAPACCNIAHLRLGTHAENMRDMALRKRARKYGFVGEEHPRARLNWEAVLDIRREYATGKTTLKKLSRQWGVSHNHISRIVRYQSWKRPNSTAATDEAVA